jgi:HJR/Mrr/RecB family endonuclease
MLFGFTQVCLSCGLGTDFGAWSTPEGAEIGFDNARQLRNESSTVRRPAVYVMGGSATEFNQEVSIELKRALYAVGVTTLHNGNLLARISVSTTEDICRFTDYIVAVGEVLAYPHNLLVNLHDKDVVRKLLVLKHRSMGNSEDSQQSYEVVYTDGSTQQDLKALVLRLQVIQGARDKFFILPLPNDAILGEIVRPINLKLIAAISRSPALMRNLHWRDVEKLIAEVLAGLGNDVQLQKGTKDGGIDIVAFHSGLTKDKLLVQVKHPHTGRFVGVEPVQRLSFIRGDQHATKAILACTTGFTAGAKKLLEKYRWEVEGRDRDGILEWVREYLKKR